MRMRGRANGEGWTGREYRGGEAGVGVLGLRGSAYRARVARRPPVPGEIHSPDPPDAHRAVPSGRRLPRPGPVLRLGDDARRGLHLPRRLLVEDDRRLNVL